MSPARFILLVDESGRTVNMLPPLPYSDGTTLSYCIQGRPYPFGAVVCCSFNSSEATRPSRTSPSSHLEEEAADQENAISSWTTCGLQNR